MTTRSLTLQPTTNSTRAALQKLINRILGYGCVGGTERVVLSLTNEKIVK